MPIKEPSVKVGEKLNKYLDLVRDLKKLWNMKSDQYMRTWKKTDGQKKKKKKKKKIEK